MAIIMNEYNYPGPEQPSQPPQPSVYPPVPPQAGYPVDPANPYAAGGYPPAGYPEGRPEPAQPYGQAAPPPPQQTPYLPYYPPQPPPPPSYQPTGYYQPFDEKRGMAITSLVLGIASVVLSCVPFLPIVCGIVAIVLGCLSLRSPSCRGMAIAGIVCGGAGLAVMLLWMFMSTGMMWDWWDWWY